MWIVGSSLFLLNSHPSHHWNRIITCRSDRPHQRELRRRRRRENRRRREAQSLMGCRPGLPDSAGVDHSGLPEIPGETVDQQDAADAADAAAGIPSTCTGRRGALDTWHRLVIATYAAAVCGIREAHDRRDPLLQKRRQEEIRSQSHILEECGASR